MSDLGERLLAIQGVDAEIETLRHRHDALVAALAPSAEVQAARAAAADVDRRMADLTRRQRDEEGELSLIQERMKKLSTTLFGGGVTNSRELVTLEKDLVHWKEQATLHEDRVMEAMMAVDDARGTRQKVHDDLAEAEGLELRRTEQARQQIATIEDESAAHRRRRVVLTGTMPVDILQLYERLRSKMKGKVVVRLTNGACLGCGATLPTATVQRLRQSLGIPQCPACQRLLLV